MAITTRIWSTARAEVMQSVEGLFPMSASDALLGVINRAETDENTQDQGYLVAVNRQQAQPWLSAIERAAGRPIHRLLSTHMALFGAGFQHEHSTIVHERQTTGIDSYHHFQFGEVIELALSARSGENSHGACVKTLVIDSHSESPSAPETEILTARQLAVGAALAPRVAPRRFAPFIGPIAHGPRRWLAPVAASAAVVGVLVAAGATSRARLDNATRAFERAHDQQIAQLEQVERDRQLVEQRTALLSNTVIPAFESWHSILPELQAAQRTLPDKAFVYRIELNGDSLTLRGEAPRASDVLRRLEDSTQFTAARVVDAPVRVEERAAEQFHIRATRTATTGKIEVKTGRKVGGNVGGKVGGDL